MIWISDDAVQHLQSLATDQDRASQRYRMLRTIGQGGMATVYAAEDVELGREVALKVIKHHAFARDSIARMLREARIIAGLEHPGIVPVHDVGMLADGRVFYVMKLVRGRRLDEHVATVNALRDRLRLFERICETTAFAHAHGVIHRDLKPQNIMVGTFGEVLILDWGVAKVLHESTPTNDPPVVHEMEATTTDRAMHDDHGLTTHTRETAIGTIIGTPAYMAPEQSRGDLDSVDQRSDIYALGAVLYFLLTGRPPRYEGSNENPNDDYPRILSSPRRLDRSIPQPIQAVCLRAMAHSPLHRYDKAADLADEVARFLNGEPVRAYREGWLERFGRFARKYRTAIVLVLAYLIMRIALFFITSPNGSNPNVE